MLNKEKIEIFPAQQKVIVNGMEISVSSESYTVKNAENEILAVIKKTADNFVEVDSPLSHMIRVLTDAKEVVVLKDIYELLERAIDHCRDAGKVVFQIALKYA